MGRMTYDTERDEMDAVTANGYSIRYIKNPSEAVQLAAIQYNILAMTYISEPSENAQTYAIKHGCPLCLIKNPSDSARRLYALLYMI